MALARKDTTRRYRERNREKIRAKGREYANARRRALGMPALGTPESTENRKGARKVSGVEHGNWKGEQASYSAHHHWVSRHKRKTGRCSECGDEPSTRTDWANVSGEYRRNLDDYIELCVSCHYRRDRG